LRLQADKLTTRYPYHTYIASARVPPPHKLTESD
jgi:hypothetical protein